MFLNKYDSTTSKFILKGGANAEEDNRNVIKPTCSFTKGRNGRSKLTVDFFNNELGEGWYVEPVQRTVLKRDVRFLNRDMNRVPRFEAMETGHA